MEGDKIPFEALARYESKSTRNLFQDVEMNSILPSILIQASYNYSLGECVWHEWIIVLDLTALYFAINSYLTFTI